MSMYCHLVDARVSVLIGQSGAMKIEFTTPFKQLHDFRLETVGNLIHRCAGKVSHAYFYATQSTSPKARNLLQVDYCRPIWRAFQWTVPYTFLETSNRQIILQALFLVGVV